MRNIRFTCDRCEREFEEKEMVHLALTKGREVALLADSQGDFCSFDCADNWLKDLISKAA